MRTKERQPVDASAGYEKTDIPMRDIKIGLVGLALFAILAPIVSIPIMMWGLNAQVGAPKVTEHYDLRQIPAPPNPILQDDVTNHIDTVNLRRREEERLNTEGVDSRTGKRHIPIDQAIAEEAAKSGR